MVSTVTQWLQDVLREANRQGEDAKTALLRHMDPPSTIMLWCPIVVARYIVDRVRSATIEELPFWGWTRIRKANHIFSEQYSGMMDCDDAPPPPPLKRRKKQVRFAPGPHTIHELHDGEQ